VAGGSRGRSGTASVTGWGDEEKSSTGRVISAPAFTGRQHELAALSRVLAAPPALVLVEGEAGIGKSRLVREFLARADGKQQHTMVAACPPFRRPCTLSPMVDAIRQAAGSPGELGLSGLAGALRPLFPEWSAGLPPAPEPAEDATAARHRLFRALDELLACLGVTVLVVEDVHWADEATLEFLLFLGSQQGPRPSLVLTYRPEDVPNDSLLLRLSSRMPGGSGGLRLTLYPLPVAETVHLVSSMLDGERVSEAFAEFLHQRTDGVPLAVEETVLLMHDRADLARRNGSWVRRSLGEIMVPATIRDGVLERTRRLGAGAQGLLAAAAVLAGPADEAALRAVAGLTAAQLGPALAESLRCGLLAEDGRGKVSFRHVLAARAVYEAIAVPERRVMHRRAGHALERRSPQPIGQLARHYREAGQPGKWCRYAEQTAEMALSAGDEVTASTLLLDLLTSGDLPADAVVRLVKKIPLAFTGQSRFADVVSALRSVVDGQALDQPAEAEARMLLGRVLLVMDERGAGRAEVERAIPHLAGDPREAARAMILLGWPAGTDWPAGRHRQWLARAAEMTRSLEPDEQLSLNVGRASALLMLGDPAGWSAAARIPDDAPSSQERQHVVKAHLNIANMAMLWGRYGEARRRLAKGLELAEHHGYWRYRDLILVNQAHLDWLAGAWDGLADRAAALAADPDLLPLARLETVLVTGLMQAAAGDRAQAGRTLDLVLAEVRQRSAVESFMEPAAALARLLLADGRAEDALAVTDEPIGILNSKGTWVWAVDIAPVRVEALVAAGRADEAAELIWVFAEENRDRDAPATAAALTGCRAILAEGRGRQAKAATLFARAADAWHVLPRPYEELLARERQARCLLVCGQQPDALPVLAEVLDGLSSLGARGDAMRVIRTLNEQGVQARRPWWGGRRGYGDRLSPRELDVVRLVIDGRTNRQVAEELVLSPKTVANHVDSLMRKLGVSSRTALAVRAVEAGIVSGTGSPN
jgi:DNA-binding CsgD family transcriptional regulator/tetratricopeptide (TPR) repeat protein